MALLNEQVIAETRQILAAMRDPVDIRYFTREMECHACTHTDAFLAEMAAAEPRVRVERVDFLRESVAAAALGIHHAPAMALRAGGRFPVRYYGLPAGHEYGVFLRTLVMFSTGRAMEGLDPAAAAAVERETNLKVFFLHACPRCPEMVLLCNSLAFLNPRVTAEAIDANAFLDLARRFSVAAVPRVVIDDGVQVADVVSAAELVSRIRGASAAPAPGIPPGGGPSGQGKAAGAAGA